jgi:hypothetical protein
MFATLLMLYRNYEKRAGLNTQGRLHQQPRKDPLNRLKASDVSETHLISILREQCLLPEDGDWMGLRNIGGF